MGDTISDIEAGVKNHIPSIAADYGYGKDSETTRASFHVSSFSEILSCVAKCNVYQSIWNDLTARSARVIGINGVDTSGKTTFTNGLSKFLTSIGVSTQLIHMGDFHNPSAIRYHGETEVDAYYTNAFNYEQLISKLLQPIKEGSDINKALCCLDLDTDQYEKNIHYQITSDTIVLLEGVLLF